MRGKNIVNEEDSPAPPLRLGTCSDEDGVSEGNVKGTSQQSVPCSLEMRAHDLPSAGQVETSYLLCKAMKEDATVAISGEAADEIFGGYPWLYSEEAMNTPIFPWFAVMREQAGGISRQHHLTLYRLIDSCC
ncbi:hypothetical protein EPA93_45505 [Ktedonosporobacter rubrisoli]|uniref:asparagine synthase (glutamine-hydrolyzing) n=1 Tax=Ktedonosporobacter rubrisoli TaxID=2509675 RepID=A0A4P6K3K0_KTERU|nr:asparagine synthase-related protein [Ktedonosporobacter rubrisoli]QBD82838.1 hypothetical protein EPA93_45505 [Ktedonosporobacter rubrisoli]